MIERRFKMTPCILLAVCLLALGCSCATDAVTGKRVTNIYSINDDIAMGQATLEENTRQMRAAGVPINEDRNRLRLLEEMMGRIAAVSDMPDLPYTVTLYQTNIVNAAAAPGGSLMFFEGLYDKEKGLVHDDDELAAVMAHEIAHVTCRHSSERQSKLKAINIVGTVAVAAAGAAGYGDVADLALNVGGALWLPSYTRKDEAEADRIGIMYMAKAGYDPRAAPRIWQRAAKKGKGTSIFSTHPSEADRYDKLMNLLPEAMEHYKAATGSYPKDYKPPSN